MSHLIKIDKRNGKKGYALAVDSGTLMITQRSARGNEHVFIPLSDVERFLAELDHIISERAGVK